MVIDFVIVTNLGWNWFMPKSMSEKKQLIRMRDYLYCTWHYCTLILINLLGHWQHQDVEDHQGIRVDTRSDTRIQDPLGSAWVTLEHQELFQSDSRDHGHRLHTSRRSLTSRIPPAARTASQQSGSSSSLPLAKSSLYHRNTSTSSWSSNVFVLLPL